MTERLPPFHTAGVRPKGPIDAQTLDRILAYQDYIRQRMQELTRSVSKAAAGDFSEKPAILEEDDEVSQFVVGFRFMLEDLELARDEQERRAEQLKDAYERLRFQTVLFQRQSEASPDGILVVNPEGEMIIHNQRFAEMWGLDEDILKTGNDEAAIAAVLGRLQDPEAFVQRVQKYYADKQAEGRDEILLKDGRVFERHTAPLNGPDGTHHGRVWYFRDVTSSRRASQELQQANVRLKDLSRLKTQFINNVAHELATPLTPLKLQLHMLRSQTLGPLNAQQERAVEIVDRNLDRLADLVRDVLDVARLEGNAFRLTTEPMDLADVVHETVEAFRPTAANQKVQLTYRNTTPLPVLGDPARLSQVLFNLLSNAFKFTPSGGSILVEAEALDQEAVVHVRDTGSGLDEKDFGRLFQPFSQVHDTMQTTEPGSGLGLYITQGIVERHGGRIWCDSPGKGRGAVFSFALPATTATKEAARRTPATPDHCPQCRSLDVSWRRIRDRYECNACDHHWGRGGGNG